MSNPARWICLLVLCAPYTLPAQDVKLQFHWQADSLYLARPIGLSVLLQHPADLPVEIEVPDGGSWELMKQARYVLNPTTDSLYFLLRVWQLTPWQPFVLDYQYLHRGSLVQQRATSPTLPVRSLLPENADTLSYRPDLRLLAQADTDQQPAPVTSGWYWLLGGALLALLLALLARRPLYRLWRRYRLHSAYQRGLRQLRQCQALMETEPAQYLTRVSHLWKEQLGSQPEWFSLTPAEVQQALPRLRLPDSLVLYQCECMQTEAIYGRKQPPVDQLRQLHARLQALYKAHYLQARHEL
ncbi:MAG: hypothetical protein LW884_04610 [Bacteroidetes bacterium]|jgi:hypothetical protein|nr:hypothetical protein [Bacteroidota bacterium]